MIEFALAVLGIYFTIVIWLWVVSIGAWIFAKAWKLVAFGAAAIVCAGLWEFAPAGLLTALAWGGW